MEVKGKEGEGRPGKDKSEKGEDEEKDNNKRGRDIEMEKQRACTQAEAASLTDHIWLCELFA